MSTKTTFKRIALVAVAALTLGSLSAVSASAAAPANFASTPSVASSTATALVGSTNAVVASVSSATALDGAQADTLKVTAAITVPTASSVSLSDNDGALSNATASVFADTGKNAVFANSAILAGVVTATTVSNQSETLAASTAAALGTFTIKPDAPGTYVLSLTGRDAANAANTTSVTYTLTVRSLSYTLGDGAAATPYSTGNGIAGPANTVTVTGYSTQATGVRALVTVSGAGSSILSGSNTPVIAADKLSATVGAVSSSALVIATPTAGTITVNLYNETGNGTGIFSATASNTVTITVGVTALSGGLDAATSTSVIKAGATWAAGTSAATDDVVLVSRTASTTPVAVVKISLAQVAGAITTTTAVTASISGSGTIILNNDNDATTTPIAAGRSVSSTIAATSETFYVLVLPDGNSGVGTVTVTAGGYTATETVTFYGSATKYVVDSTTPATVVSALGVGNTQAWDLSTVDAAGNAVQAAPTIYAVSSDTSILTVAVAAGVVTATGVKAGTATFTVCNTPSCVSPTVTLGPVSVLVTNTKADSATFTLDKSDYIAGEAFTLTISAKDAAGVLADGTYASMATLTTSVLVNSTTGGLVSGPLSPIFTAGKATVKGFMPQSTGAVIFTLTLGAKGTPGVADAAAGAVFTAAGNVTSAAVDTAQAATDAAAEATDAANAATDAANAAAEAADAATAAAQDAADAVAALSTQVAEMIDALKKQITALTNLVIKIQKKVKA